MKARIALVALVLITLIVAFVAVGMNDGEVVTGAFATPVSADVAVLYDGAAGLVAGPVSRPGSTAIPPLPSNPAIARYRFLATCAKYRRISVGIGLLEQDPHSWLNSEQARSALSAEQVEGLHAMTEFVEANSDQCASAPPGGDPVTEIYRAALLAGYAGDIRAANCYVRAPWPQAVDGGAPSPMLREEYVANVQAMIDVGLRAGDWDMVALLISAHAASTHGLQAIALPNDPAKAYGYQWLQRLGASGALATQADKSLEIFAGRISPAEVARQQAWAEEIYSNYFADKGMASNLSSCDL